MNEEGTVAGNGGDAGVRRRVVEWRDPMPYVQQGLRMAPVEYLRRMVHGEIPPAPIAELMGMSGIELEEGRAVFRARPGEEHFNPVGLVHGGLVATLIDSAMACAIHSMLPPGGYFTTLQLNVNFVRPVRADGEDIRCEAEVVHCGRTIGTAEGRVTDARGKLVAHGTTTCMLFRPSEEDAGAPAEAAADAGANGVA